MKGAPQSLWSLLLALLSATLVLAHTACASAGRLAEYDFRDQALAVVTVAPFSPRVVMPPGSLESIDDEKTNVLGAILEAGTLIVREREARRATERMDSAAKLVDVATLTADKALSLCARSLRARAVEHVEDADFELEIYIQHYGIAAETWTSVAHFFVQAEVELLDAATGERIWKAKVKEDELIQDRFLGTLFEPGHLVTAAVLAELDVEEMAMAFEALAEYSALAIDRKLRDGLERAREQRAQD
jgi:hypothetical protein